jgi:hypothetical protein
LAVFELPANEYLTHVVRRSSMTAPKTEKKPDEMRE